MTARHLTLLVFSVVTFGCSREPVIKRVNVEIATIEAAMEQYKYEYGNYPRGSAPLVARALTGFNQRKIAFIELERSENGSIIDPWGQPYVIQFKNDGFPGVSSLGNPNETKR